VYQYIKIGLSQCVSTGVAWMDGRQSSERRLGRRGGVAYEVRGYKQGWADGQADSPNRAKIALART